MSEDRDNHPFDMFVTIGSKTNDFFNFPNGVPHLTALDISGIYTSLTFFLKLVRKFFVNLNII